jgi:RNA polymerase sigma-70 factor, ECF subfamily
MKPPHTVQEEFLRAFEEWSQALFNHSYYRVSNREIAKDLVQETFTKTWEYLAGGKTIDNLKSFLFKVLNNLITDHYRKKKSDSLDVLQEAGFDVAGSDDEKIVSLSESQNAIKALKELDERFRQVVVMRYIDELSPREIASIIGESENAVSVRINRSLRKLKEILRIEDDGK